MMHFLGYRADGGFGSIHTFQGGWPASRDLADANSTDEFVIGARERMLVDGIVGFIGVDCECACEAGSCSCAGTIFSLNYVKDGVMVPRPTTTKMQLDGADVADKAKLPRVPGTKMQFRVVAPDVEDGQVVTVSINGALLHLEAVHELTITGGMSPEIELTAPAQGAVDIVSVGGIQVAPLRLDIIGFA